MAPPCPLPSKSPQFDVELGSEVPHAIGEEASGDRGACQWVAAAAAGFLSAGLAGLRVRRVDAGVGCFLLAGLWARVDVVGMRDSQCHATRSTGGARWLGS